MSKNILITGGAGFVGSSLGIGLASLHPNWKIFALDNLKRRGSELNLSRLKAVGIEFIHGDVRNEEDLEDLYIDDFFWMHERGVDLIFIFS